MIVTCERCATQFQLDDERVPDEGVRVRCSRCKHAFFIERPARTEAERIHSVARRALADQETPEVAHDLPSNEGSPPLRDQNGFGSSAGGGGSPRAEDEDDWQFNLDGPREDGFEEASAPESLEAANDAVDELLATDADFDEADERDEVESGAASARWDDAPLVPDPDEEAASSRDLASHAHPAAGDALPEAVGKIEPEVDPWEPPTPTGPTDAEPAAEPPEMQSFEPVEALEGPTTSLVSQDPDELAGPDEWDLFAGDTPAHEIPGVDRPRSRSLSTVPAARRPSVPAGSAEQGPALPRGLQRAGRAVGWIVALGLFGFGLHGGLAGAGRPTSSPSTEVEIQSMRLQGVSGHWIDNRVAGPLFVVSGVVENEGPGAATRLLVELLDAQGRRLESPPVFVGPALSAQALREEDPRSLQRIQQSRDLGLGGSRPFHAIVTGMPPEASRFRFAPATAHDTPALPTSGASVAAAPGSRSRSHD